MYVEINVTNVMITILKGIRKFTFQKDKYKIKM